VTPVFDLTTGWLSPQARPEWLACTGIGLFSVPSEGGRFDRHFHEDDELWLITRGKAKIFSDGTEHYVQAGDVVVTRAGDTHDVVEVYEALEGFFVETGHPAGGRPGHLHRLEGERAGHAVPVRELPDDFPPRRGPAKTVAQPGQLGTEMT
jgi:mannose-6-phosphate isomerase-like protein (cupin superfamily)